MTTAAYRPIGSSRSRILFEQDPEAALIFGKVSIPDELKGNGFAADFEPHQRTYYQ